MPDLFVLLATLIAFLLAGTVKGVIGMGLPTVSLALLTLIIDLHSAMALMLVPCLATNVWQALAGGHGREVLGRVWPFLITATTTVWIGAQALTRVELHLLSALLGLLLVIYALLSLSGVQMSIKADREIRVGVGLGALNGVLTGMTGAFSVPGVMYLQAIGLQRDLLIQAMGMLFLVSTLALALAMQNLELLTLNQALLSSLALAPAFVGMIAGQKIRKRLSEKRFRLVFFLSLLLLGNAIVARSLGWV